VAETQVSDIAISGSAPLELRTTINYQISGQINNRTREQRTGEWELRWRRTADNQWLITGWVAKHENRSRLMGRGFVEIAGACFGEQQSFRSQMKFGIDHWRTILDGACGIDVYGNNGISAGDFQGDGVDGLYICQPAGLPNRLYRNRGDGTFEDVTEKAGVGILDATSSAIFADVTNRGLQDLIIVRNTGPVLFANRGDGTFELKPKAFDFARPPQGSFTGAAVADYDRNGLLDVYFSLYSFYQGLSEQQLYPKPYYDAQNGPANFLFRNRGDGTFEDVTVSSGMDQSNHRYTLACTWNDYNNDGWPDLYVVNDFGRNVLFKNNGDGTFSDVSAETGVEEASEGMSATWFDYDNDGREDLYVVNMWEAAGMRVTAQEQFLPSAAENVRRMYRRMYRQDALGNRLLHNEAGGAGFRDVSSESGTRFGGWNWGSDAWDFDHDGYPDLYVANGFISGQDRKDVSSFYWRHVVATSLDQGGVSKAYEDAWNVVNECIRSDYTWSGYQRNNFYVNNKDGSFTEAAGVLGLDCLEDGRSFALSDIDGDGRLEVILKNRTAPQIKVFQNQLSPLGPVVGFSLKGTKSNRDAIGAVVELQTASGRQRKCVRAGSGFLTQHTKTLYFGLGTARGGIKAHVEWPSGLKQSFDNLQPDHCFEIEEGRAIVKGVPFKKQRFYAPSKEDGSPGLPSSYESWLVEPITVPSLHLPDGSGQNHSLDEAKGGARVVIFWRPGCQESGAYLRAVEDAKPRWEKGGLAAFSVQLKVQGVENTAQQPAEHPVVSFPALIADEATEGRYGVLFRYLFDRRREMASPTSFLLNKEGELVKVYSGSVDADHILEDSLAIPTTVEDRMEHALPFTGRYLGGGLHHDYFTLGVAYLQYSYPEEAILAFKRAIAITPEHAGALYNLALIYLNKGMLTEAEACLKKTIALDPSNANAWNNLGVVFANQRKFDEALRHFQQALTLHPEHMRAIQNLVRLYEYQRDPEEARKVLEKAISASPAESGLHVELAQLLADQKDLAGARREFEQAVKMEPGNAQALNGLGVVFMKAGNAQEAAAYFEQCIQSDPDFDKAYLNKARMLADAGDPGQAKSVLKGYLEKHPGSTSVMQALKGLEEGK
jgi:Tfp pilus assembly protein PilF